MKGKALVTAIVEKINEGKVFTLARPTGEVIEVKPRKRRGRVDRIEVSLYNRGTEGAGTGGLDEPV